MIPSRFPRGASRGSFLLLGLLVVVAIILLLFAEQWAPDPLSGKSTQQMAIDRSKDAACTMNRQALATQIMSWTISHPGETPTIEGLSKTGISIPRCPRHGTYSIDPDGRTVYCSIHAPAPGTAPTPLLSPSPTPNE